jgi:hypothetical protein
MLLIPSVLLQVIRNGSFLPSLNRLIEELATCNDPAGILMFKKDIDDLKHRTYWMLITVCCNTLTDRHL